MFKILAFSVALLSGAGSCLVSAQTATNYTDNTASTVRTASPEAKAESKRLYKEGVKYGLAGLFPQAVEILQRAVKLDPQHADAHYALGHAYYDLKQWRNAIESLKTAVELNPKDQEARDRLGLARAMLWEEDNARLAAQRPKVVPTPAPKPVPTPQAQQVSSKPEAQQVSLNVKAPSAPQPEPTKAPPTPEPEPAATPSDSDEVNAATKDLALTKIYRVGPNDVLDIRVNDSASPQSTLFTVTPTGFVEHPMLAEPDRKSVV